VVNSNYPSFDVMAQGLTVIETMASEKVEHPTGSVIAAKESMEQFYIHSGIAK